MSEQRPLERALSPLRADAAPVALSLEARARILASMRAEVRALPRVRRRARAERWLGAGLALAACFTVAWWARPASELATLDIAAEGALVWTDDARVEHVLRGAQKLSGDGTLVVPEHAQAELVTPIGVRVHATADTRVRVQHGAQDLVLERGSVRCQVPKLGAARSFAVEAKGARVIVHGTAFSVALDAAPTPCVRVSEGRVEVRAAEGTSVMLTPGTSWGCVSPVVAPTPRLDVRAAEDEPTAVRTRRHHRRRAAIAAPDSTLREENALLSAALRAEREHAAARAHGLFDELRRRYPKSPLVPEAEAGARRTAAE